MARIMVVEDDVYMREELTDLLRKSGYETVALFDFENAISEIAEYSPDLVLLDINLPFHSGFEIMWERVLPSCHPMREKYCLRF